MGGKKLKLFVPSAELSISIVGVAAWTGMTVRIVPTQSNIMKAKARLGHRFFIIFSSFLLSVKEYSADAAI
jgi:hypothetical protein